ncbi:Survival protein SurA precursor (Peptidyl-prolyl cis-trans isomerase SurA) [Roseibacterium elongatum DSM 19469]|uniref:Parvulin-like PPIase n=1 Tax=Roseicyclus elongatus DSM 19469 TaxID=1294273 RepID=W8SSJ2_9RHOB|nr:peptidylprolyl isomerase [Roseibacterium elongatum]AHM05470.1 Survival protein SurA precursor (Peptidyl-prolyl cis-trans isomerase SurA) [Roseibacterium elongatum DSM 19469]
MTKTALFPRTTLFALFCLVVTGCAAALSGISTASAQSPFSAAARVNDSIVTYYEIGQRQQFLRVLNAPDTGAEDVLETLIDERLQNQAGERLGVVADEEQIETGVEEFAGRANMGAEQFVRALAQEGVAPETFRDFVAAGITWRNVVRARFGRDARVSEDEIDRALASGITTGGMRVRLAELIIPITPQNEANLTSELARLAADVQGSNTRFSEAARRFSAAPSREAGGLTDWRPLTALPPQLQQLMMRLSPGQVTDPINLGNAVGLFQLRGLSETPVGAPEVSSIDFLTVAIPGGRSPEALAEAQRLRDRVDTCDDFYGLMPGGFERVTQPVGEIPSDIAAALATLDEDEASLDVTRGDGTVLLFTMLCGRSFNVPETARDEVQQVLFQQRLESYASGYLQELRADAIISYTGG